MIPDLSWPMRIANYERETGFPKSLFIADDGRIVGTRIMGNDYRKCNRQITEIWCLPAPVPCEHDRSEGTS